MTNSELDTTSEFKAQFGDGSSGSILDAINLQEQNSLLRSFQPLEFVLEHLSKLPSREREILIGRHGLGQEKPLTLEKIGRNLKLTRERVRQIEKGALRKLQNIPLSPNLEKAAELIYQLIETRGKILRESLLMELLQISHSLPYARRGVTFILNINPRFNLFPESDHHYQSWHTPGFDRELFDMVVAAAHAILEEKDEPVHREHLPQIVRERLHDLEDVQRLSPEAIESYAVISKNLHRNPFDQWGVRTRHDILPRDVGDKAYLVLLHDGQPEHYSKITELINKAGFDNRTAYKETVHNELIKDDRFVLVGRGIYALKKWGYRQGVVADIITEILRQAKEPLSRAKIVEEVLKQRLVKKNTIIVGLANRKFFKKTSDNKYTLA